MGLFDFLLGRGPRVQHLTPGAAHELLREHGETVQFLDVRNRREYKSGHAHGAKNVALNTLPNRLQHLDRDRPVVCICQSGGRSARAAHMLVKRGFETVYNVEGGSTAWKARRLPWKE